MSADKTIVIRNISSYDDTASLRAAVRGMFSHAPFAGGIAADKTVLVKVNALMKSRPDEAVTTHPAVVSAVIEELKSLGAKKIILADSPSGAFGRSRLAGIYESAGFAALEGEGVSIYRSDEAVTISGRGAIKDFEILKCIAEADIKIGVGKLKTHALMGMTGAVKLWLGAVPGLKKTEIHCRFPDKDDFADMLCSLYNAIFPDFSVIDAVEGMEGNGPSGGEKRSFGFVAGGADGFALDRALCHMLGLAPERALTVRSSIASGLAPLDADEITVEGDSALMREPFSDLRLPDTFTGAARAAEDGALVRRVKEILAPRPRIRKKDCVGCGACAEICPRGAIEIVNGTAKINNKNCMRCFCCHEVCPQRAIDITANLIFRVMR